MKDGVHVYQVSEISRMIRSTLENTFGEVWIEGEISNVRRPASGHYYFTVKDQSAQISAVLFKGSQRGMKIHPEDGSLMRLFGEITVYEKAGNYQLLVRKLEEAGKGALHVRFEKLKKKLMDEGLFDEARKASLPMLPRRVGVVTSRTGAAIRDILNVVERRFPNLQITIVPVKVQGEGAAEEIAAGIQLLNDVGGVDVMIVGRGGGSIEDLWCFNEEVVARAIAASGVPVISAVGHEIDFTISDFVADLRAATPSAAAELVVGRKEEFEGELKVLESRCSSAVESQVLKARHRIERAGSSYVFKEPVSILKQHAQTIDGLQTRMEHSLTLVVHSTRQSTSKLLDPMRHALELRLRLGAEAVGRLNGQLRALSPLSVLERGYSVTTREDGTVLKDSSDLEKGTLVKTRLAKGVFESKVSVVTDE
jgi:exodeoxyribonuclease VII large subunit